MTAKTEFGKDYFDACYGGAYERRNPPVRLDFHLRQVRAVRPSGRLLDVGCAFGSFLARAREHYEAAGCDISAHALEQARAALPGLPLFRADIATLPDDQRYDVITCFDVLEHLANPAQGLAKLVSLLAPGGAVAITIPVYDTPAGLLVRLLDRDPTHRSKEGRRFWRRLIEAAGLRIVTDMGLWRYSFGGHLPIFFGGRIWRNFSPALLLIGVRA